MINDNDDSANNGHQNSKGFGELYKLRDGSGARFHDLLE